MTVIRAQHRHPSAATAAPSRRAVRGCAIAAVRRGVWRSGSRCRSRATHSRCDAGHGVTIEDRNGIVAPLDARRRRQQCALGGVRPHRSRLINAFVAVEDRRFWDHHGVDVACRRSRACATTFARGTSSRARRRSRCSSRGCCVRRSRHVGGKAGADAVGAAARRASLQAADPRAVPESRRARAGNRRRRRGERALLQYVAERVEHRAGGDARRPRARAVARQPAGLARAAPARAAPSRSTRMHRAGVRDARRRRACAARSRSSAARARRRSSRRTSRRASWRGPTKRATRRASDRIRTSLDVALQAELESEFAHTVATLGDRGVGEAAAVVLDNATGEVAGVGRLARFLER